MLPGYKTAANRRACIEADVTGVLLLVARVVFDPRAAAYVAALLVGEPDLGPRLEAICERESKCTIIGAHPDDAGQSRAVWTAAARTGKLDPRCQPHRARAWSTRGSFGTMAAYTVVHLPGTCWQPEALDIPILAAFASARRMKAPACRRVRGCRHWAS